MAEKLISQRLLDLRTKVFALELREELNCPFDSLILDYVFDIFKQSKKREIFNIMFAN